MRRRLLAVLLGFLLGIVGAETLTIAYLEPSSRRYVAVRETAAGSVLQTSSKAERGITLDWLSPVPQAPRRGVLRIGVFGASTTVGLPYAKPHTIWHWLELEAEHAYAGLDLEFYNFGQPGIALRQILDIANEIPPGFLDAAIVCCGNNEFLNEHAWYATHAVQAEAPSYAWDPWRFLRSIDWVVTQWEHAHSLPLPAPNPNADSILDGGDAQEQYAQVIAHAAERCERLVRCLKRKASRVFFILPAGNVWQSAPGQSAFAARRSPAVRANCRASLSAALLAMQTKDASAARTALLTVIAEAEEVALAHGYLAHLELDAGQIERARTSMARAVELDVRPAWLATPLRRELQRVLRSSDVKYLDVDQLLSAQADPRQVMHLFTDHCHPTIKGQQQIAAAAFEELAAAGWFGALRVNGGERPISAAEARSVADAENTALALAAHLNFLVQLATPLPRYSTEQLRDRFVELSARGATKDWRIGLEYALTRAMLDEWDAARRAIEAILGAHSEAAPLLALMMQGSPRLGVLLRNLQIDLKR